MIGAPDEGRGQIVEAHVVLKDGVIAGVDTVKRLQDHVKATIAPFKYPRSVKFVDALPKTANRQNSALPPQPAVNQRHAREAGIHTTEQDPISPHYGSPRSRRRQKEIRKNDRSSPLLHPRAWKQPKGFANGIAAEGRLGFPRRPGRLERRAAIRERRFRRASAPGAGEYRRAGRRSRRQAGAHYPPDLVRARQKGISVAAERTWAMPIAA